MKRITLGILVAFLLAATTIAKGADVMIEDGKKVKMEYTLKVNGEIVDSSEGREPLEYTQGQGAIIPGLEKQLVGLKVGDKKTVTVSPEEAYGAVNPDAFAEVPKANMPQEQEPQKGMMLQMQTPDGKTLNGTITEVKDETVVLDFNHPLAGKELLFDIEIVGIE
ncbi:MAG: peptidylprolyl isomerase [Candidatus Aceula meridiana]|nr:peptidylprolyl isomerase [Candidatus Aceula meridiana]